MGLMAEAACLEELLLRHQLQQGRCGWSCVLHGAGGSQEPAGAPSPFELVGWEPRAPGRSYSLPAMAADPGIPVFSRTQEDPLPL